MKSIKKLEKCMAKLSFELVTLKFKSKSDLCEKCLKIDNSIKKSSSRLIKIKEGHFKLY